MGKMNEPRNDYPSTNLVYEFVQPSYAWMLGRLDAVEGRVQRIQTLAAALSFAAPVFVRSLRPTIPVSWHLYVALALFGLILVLGIASRFIGAAVVPDIGVMREQSLHLPPEEFKRDHIYFAAQHFDQNHLLFTRKAKIAVGMTVVFGLEVVAMVLWWLTP